MKAIVIGAGIVGLATARALAVRGHTVTVLERSPAAVGASIRNFGMIWPIGQPDGALYERSLLSRRLWREICTAAKIWHDPVGSLHLAYADDEWQVLQELHQHYKDRNYQLISAREAAVMSPAVVPRHLTGGLYSPDEMIVDPRQAIASIPAWLAERFGVVFDWGRAASFIDYPNVYCDRKVYEADLVYVCNGADFETLYPESFAAAALIKCKLQMMRLVAQPGHWRIGPALCGGLSLLHYKSFAAARSLPALRSRLEADYPEYLQAGIHVMVSQNENGELTVGDSHEYGMSPGPFDSERINRLILQYLRSFAHFPDDRLLESWNGVYAKSIDGKSEVILHPEEGVTIINGLGGAGMTLAFGLCEETISQVLDNRG